MKHVASSHQVSDFIFSANVRTHGIQGEGSHMFPKDVRQLDTDSHSQSENQMSSTSSSSLLLLGCSYSYVISSLASVIREPITQHSTMTDLSSYRVSIKPVSVLVLLHSSGVELLLGPGLCNFLSNYISWWRYSDSSVHCTLMSVQSVQCTELYTHEWWRANGRKLLLLLLLLSSSSSSSLLSPLRTVFTITYLKKQTMFLQYSVAVVLYLQFALHVMLFPMLNMFCTPHQYFP